MNKTSKPRAPIFDPVEEARAMAFHLGRETAALRKPIAPIEECAADLRTAEVEHIMQGAPA